VKKTFYLLVCRDCGNGDLIMPFGSPAERGKWAAGHTHGTGHAQWLVHDEVREVADDMPLWWLSFIDPTKKRGTRFLGVVVVEGADLAAAITRSHLLGVNPGGEIEAAGPLPAGCIATEWRDRLLTSGEANSIPEPHS